jgi:hypothetical protein
MKGIIFNIAEQYITDKYGADKYEAILENCSLATREPFVGPGTYPDEDLVEILVKSSASLNITVADLLKDLGFYSFAKLAGRHPGFLEGFTHPKDFLKTVDGIIHVEVRKLYQGSKLPVFQYAEPSENELIITYYSERKLYPFMEGLILGVERHFKVPIQLEHSIYQKDGSEFCDFHLRFS